MFRHIRRWFETYKQSLFDSYEPPKPTVYKLGNKRYIKVKRLNTKGNKGPYLKEFVNFVKINLGLLTRPVCFVLGTSHG